MTLTAYTRELVLKKIRETFPKHREEEILALLDTYGIESYEHERERVQLAVLWLSEGDEYKLLHNIGEAKKDYRDVLYWAEYFTYSKGSRPTGAFLAWLEE